jgi:hypothetical protein
MPLTLIEGAEAIRRKTNVFLSQFNIKGKQYGGFIHAGARDRTGWGCVVAGNHVQDKCFVGVWLAFHTNSESGIRGNALG